MKQFIFAVLMSTTIVALNLQLQAEEPLTFPYCVSTPLPVIDLTVTDGSKESSWNGLIDCRDITSISIAKISPFANGLDLPKIGRGISGSYLFQQRLSTSIPFCNIRQASLNAVSALVRVINPYDFILGRDFLQDSVVTLDPAAKKMTIEHSDHPANERLLPEINASSMNISIGGRTLAFRFDLTCSASLVLSESTYRFIKKTNPGLIEIERQVWNYDTYVCLLSKIDYHGATFPHVWCMVEGSEDVVGMGLLTKFNCKLDFNSNEFHLEPNLSVSSMVDHSFLDGLWLRHDPIENSHRFVVHSILTPSIASDSGFRKGDILTKVGSIDLTRPTKREVANAFHLISTPREMPLNCTIRRDGHEMQIGLLAAYTHLRTAK